MPAGHWDNTLSCGNFDFAFLKLLEPSPVPQLAMADNLPEFTLASVNQLISLRTYLTRKVRMKYYPLIISGPQYSVSIYRLQVWRWRGRGLEARSLLPRGEMEEDWEAAGPELQGAAGVAGLGRGQVRGEAGGQEVSSLRRPAAARGSGGCGGRARRHAQQRGQTETEQDGEETGHCASQVSRNLRT